MPEKAQPFGAARDPLVTLSGSRGQLSARGQASEESLLAMAARSECFGATASKDSSLELAPQCCPAVTAAAHELVAAGPATGLHAPHRTRCQTPILGLGRERAELDTRLPPLVATSSFMWHRAPREACLGRPTTL